mmetsp:Transcript_608/g.850  ORF Transcript_608/g.850 Transcript_608/m.850 type:complete len:81 (-) Transcript_608:6-248(-)
MILAKKYNNSKTIVSKIFLASLLPAASTASSYSTIHKGIVNSNPILAFQSPRTTTRLSTLPSTNSFSTSYTSTSSSSSSS